MRNIMASVAESEYGTIFVDAQIAVTIRTTLNEMGWKQGPMAIQVNNYVDPYISVGFHV